MPTITIEPATAQRTDDAEHALTGGGDGASCQCRWWMITNAEFQRADRAERERQLRAELDAGPPPALIAYVDGEPAAWIRVGPRAAHVRLLRTRALAPHLAEPLDDPAIWTVSCFVVRREHRGLGLTARLLEAAIAHARDQGARLIEAYPIDTDAAKRGANDLYTGVLSVFEQAGFQETARPKPERAVVRLDLSER